MIKSTTQNDGINTPIKLTLTANQITPLPGVGPIRWLRLATQPLNSNVYFQTISEQGKGPFIPISYLQDFITRGPLYKGIVVVADTTGSYEFWWSDVDELRQIPFPGAASFSGAVSITSPLGQLPAANSLANTLSNEDMAQLSWPSQYVVNANGATGPQLAGTVTTSGPFTADQNSGLPGAFFIGNKYKGLRVSVMPTILSGGVPQIEFEIRGSFNGTQMLQTIMQSAKTGVVGDVLVCELYPGIGNTGPTAITPYVGVAPATGVMTRYTFNGYIPEVFLIDFKVTGTGDMVFFYSIEALP